MRYYRVVLLLAALFAVRAHAEGLEDSCECTCYLNSTHTSTANFPSHTCSACNVTTCARKFPRSCGVEGANITTDCTERAAWYLRFIPALFVVATFALLFYGFFIKTFDGYHPVPQPGDEESSPLSSFSAAPYLSVSHTPFEPRQPYAVRRPSPLSQGAPLTITAARVTEPISPPVVEHASNASGTTIQVVEQNSEGTSPADGANVYGSQS